MIKINFIKRTNIIRYFVFFLVLFYLSSRSTTVVAQLDSTLHEKMQSLLLNEGLTGAVWSIVDSLGIIEVGATGVYNNKTGRLLRPTDKVNVGSITKSILATGILRLATEGKLNLNDPVKKYIPAIKIINQWEMSHPITIRHLLDHTSGLTDLRLWHFFSENITEDVLLESAFVNNSEILKVHAPPGLYFSYSNMGYALLGMVIESITKERYEKFLDNYLLKPLGMKNSSFEFASQVGSQIDNTLAWGHLDNKLPVAAMPVYLRPAAQFTTTAYDMALFTKFILGDGFINSEKFIETSLLRQIGIPDKTVAKQNGLKYGYALGFRTRDRYGYVSIIHAGNILGFTSMLYCFPDTKQAFFIAHNMDSETANYERFYEAIIKHIKPIKKNKPLEIISSGNLSLWDGFYIPLIPAVEPLAYFDLISGFSKVTCTDKHVVLNPFQKAEIKLKRVSKNLFIADGREEPSHLFYQDSLGNRLMIDAISAKKKVSNFYMYYNWISLIAGLVGLFYILLYGCIALTKNKITLITKPIFISFSGIVLIIISILFLVTQSFLRLGDITFGSVLLFIATCILPVGLIFAFFQCLKRGLKRSQEIYHFAAIVCALQWMLILISWGLLPFRLWI